MKSAKFIFTLLGAVLATMQLSAQEVKTFWEKTRARLASEPMNAQVEAVSEAVPYKKFKITLRSLDGVLFRAWLALPVQGEAPAQPWPVVITVPGYGGTQQGVMLSECQRGYAILQVFPRGQGDSTNLWKVDGSDKLTWHLDRPEGAYYQGAYADVIRAIDFAVSRKDLDHERIALVGTSQGGGISLAVAALDSRVKAVVAHVPFLCNFPLAARTTNSLVYKLLSQAKRNDEQALRTLSYFDPWQLVPQLRVPVLMSAGGKDTVCPMPTIESVYERLPGTNKSLNIYPDLAHTSCVDFYNHTWFWLDHNFRNHHENH
ncbi:MAG: acetylxylan esterase [Verrucomicrobiales bacterium]|nr:acetylxylan esterase [Verrucomicrobiales bacterium]